MEDEEITSEYRITHKWDYNYGNEKNNDTNYCHLLDAAYVPIVLRIYLY